MAKRKWSSDEELNSMIYHYLYEHDFLKSAKSFYQANNQSAPYPLPQTGSLLSLFAQPLPALNAEMETMKEVVTSSSEGGKERRRSASGSPFRRVDSEKWLTAVKIGLEDNSCILHIRSSSFPPLTFIV